MSLIIIIDTDRSKTQAFNCIAELPLDPVYEVAIQPHNAEKSRSISQNRLSFRWYGEIAAQTGQTSSEARAYCKLHLGIAIVKNGTSSACHKFREQYDSIIRPLAYEQKMALMGPPIDFPVTSLFSVKQFNEYLGEMQRHFAEQGIVLTTLDDLYNEAMGRKELQPRKSGYEKTAAYNK